MVWFHEFLCKKLQDFAEGKIKKLMILLPPQHGKSELTTRKLPGFLIGHKPNKQISVITYSAQMAAKFNRAIQRTIDSEDYLLMFPNIKLNDSKIHTDREADKQRNTDTLEILKYAGLIRTLGIGGALTGNPVDIGIIDDPIKDREAANSLAIRNALHEWYNDVFSTRLHNDSQQLIIQTRWHEDDLAGRLLRNETDWEVIKFPAIREGDINDYDPREEGQALWPEKHSLEKILGIKKASEVTFNALYQQDPKPNTNLLVFGHWKECQSFPDDVDSIFWGLDFGFTNDPTALVKIGRRGKEIFLKECCYTPGIPAPQIRQILINNGYKGEAVYCDHNDKETIAELRRTGVVAMQAIKSIEAGISKVNEFDVYFTSDSPNIRRERGLYQYTAYGELITNIPMDKENHLCDATRYGVYTHYFRS